MPQRKYTPDFTACTQFGLRYSTLGKRIAASEPYHDGENPREVTSTMNLYEMCEALDIELTEEQAEKEAEYIYENRRQYYKNHPYMEKKAIAKCYDGPVFPDDVVYRRSNCEKYTVLPDGSIVNTSGTVEVKQPNWEGFVHTAPKKHEKVATFTKGMPRKTNDKSPAITLPKQANPLVKGEYKTRTPKEESRAKAKQREQARKEAAKTTEAEKQTVRKHYGPEAVAEILPDLDDVDFVNIFREEDRRRFGDRREPFFSLITDQELAEEVNRRGIVTMAMSLEDEPTETLLKELERRHTFEPEHPTKISPLLTEKVEKKPELWDYVSQVLNTFDDKDLADELRRRGYTVTATKTVEI